MRALLLAGLIALIAAPLMAQNGGAGTKAPPGFGKQGGKIVRSGGDSGGETVDPAEVPSWNKISSDILGTASHEETPLVVYFPNEEDDNDASFSGKELAELSGSEAIFIRLPANKDREPNAWPVDTRVPQNRLLSENPSRDFEIPVGKSTVLVCDWHGNEVQRFTTIPSEATIKAALGKVADTVESRNKKLRKNYDAAKAAHDQGNRADAIKSILKNFKEGYVGLEAQLDTITLYEEIVDAAKTEAETLAEAGDKAGLQKLAKELKGTDAESAITEALAKLK